MTQATVSYLDPTTLSAIDSLELRARMIVEGLVSGMHRSPHQGFSIEFAQHRQYATGDDLRHLDWKVYGRTDKLYLKQYQKETNLDLVILVDGSGSMAYASQSDHSSGRWRKFDHAATVGAVLAYLALQQQDRVGLNVFSQTVHKAVRTSNAQGHWQSIVEVLTNTSPDPQTLDPTDSDTSGHRTDLGRLFDQILAKLSRRSLIVLLSDLFDTSESLSQALAQVQFRRHDLIVFQTLDPDELFFPFRSPVRFIGLEGEGEVGIDPAALRKSYLAAMQDHLDQAQRITRRFGFDYMLIDSSQPLGAPLSRFLAYRVAAARKGK